MMPLLVSGVQGLRDLLGDGDDFIERDRTQYDAIREGRALDELHHQPRDPARPLEAVDGGDVRMVERRQNFGFALEPDQPVIVGGDRPGQHFDCHGSLQVRIRGPIHFAHSVGPNLGGDLVRADAVTRFQRHVCAGWL
jgi:hypothetical protein